MYELLESERMGSNLNLLNVQPSRQIQITTFQPAKPICRHCPLAGHAHSQQNPFAGHASGLRCRDDPHHVVYPRRLAVYGQRREVICGIVVKYVHEFGKEVVWR
ncbi:hypothetical protein PRUPE_6G304500 [Prunus persica]|uniref:Uncharacterized protein n=1 Tax=Prunus persica TaxID=3760 RepID=A0A251NXT6_PRUPE|nr:hypothetical protein PRUPE_6G304500 [Prunus persica]